MPARRRRPAPGNGEPLPPPSNVPVQPGPLPPPPTPPAPGQPQASDSDRGDGQRNLASRLPAMPDDPMVDSQVDGASWTNPVRGTPTRRLSRIRTRCDSRSLASLPTKDKGW